MKSISDLKIREFENYLISMVSKHLAQLKIFSQK